MQAALLQKGIWEQKAALIYAFMMSGSRSADQKKRQNACHQKCHILSMFEVRNEMARTGRKHITRDVRETLQA